MLLLLSPWIIGFCVFTAVPMVLSLYYSFTHYDILTTPRWVGLDNYRYMFGVGGLGQDPNFWLSVKNTLWIIVFGVPLRIFFGIITAMLLVRRSAATTSTGRCSSCRRWRPRWAPRWCSSTCSTR